jgi:hypothetical protein
MSDSVPTDPSRRQFRHFHDVRAKASARRRRLRLGAVLSALVAGVISAVALAPTAQAAQARETCWSHTYTGRVSIEKAWRRDVKIGYGAKWHWCGRNGRVTKFVVDSTWPAPGTSKVNVDIRPENPGMFGRGTYPIFIDATTGSKSDHHRFLLSGHGGILWP